MKKSIPTEECTTGLRPLIIWGAGGHAVSVANVAWSVGYEVKNFVDQNKMGRELLGIPIIGGFSEIDDPFKYSHGIAVGDNSARERILNALLNEFKGLDFPVLIHETATISFFSNVGEGTVVMPHAVVGPNSTVGKFCLINTRASVDHDCVVQDFASLAPAAVTGGAVSIGKRSVISIGATVKHGIEIGDDSVLGAHSYLNKNLSSNQVAYGSPAKVVRGRRFDDPYLK